MPLRSLAAAPRLLGLVALALLSCSSETQKTGPPACPASSVCPSSSTTALVAGERSGDTVTAFASGQRLQIIHGPQGGQHFLADLALSTDEAGEWMASLELIDDASNLPVGANSRRMRVCSCPTFSDDIPVFLDTDQELTGTLKVSAESPSGQLVSFPDVQITVSAFP
jgi:hypothetical protein